jgi:Ferredoxin-like domain in Api92-like protein
MPNWCQNTATFRHEDPTQIDRLVKGFVNERLFGEFLPTPEPLCRTVEIGDNYNERLAELAKANLVEFGYPSWYEWNIKHWGVKWDVGEEMDSVTRIDENTVRLSFDTAWNSPVNFYEHLAAELDFDITAYYLEEGMGFVGKFTSDGGDESYNFDGSEDLEDIPEDICEHWDLASICEQREEWDDGWGDEEDADIDEDDTADADTESADGETPGKDRS